MVIPVDNYWIRYCITLVACAACVITGCASKQDMDSLESRVISLSREVEELKQKNKKLLEFEKLKVSREQKVAALNGIAEALAAARAWESEGQAFKAHCEANDARHMLIVQRMSSPERTQSIGPTEGHEPYTGTAELLYNSLFPAAKAEVYELLDQRAEEKELRERAEKVGDKIERHARSAFGAFLHCYNDSHAYPGMPKLDTVIAAFGYRTDVVGRYELYVATEDREYMRPIWYGPTPDDLRQFELR